MDEWKEGRSAAKAKLCEHKYQTAEEVGTDMLENINFYTNLSDIAMKQCFGLFTC